MNTDKSFLMLALGMGRCPSWCTGMVAIAGLFVAVVDELEDADA